MSFSESVLLNALAFARHVAPPQESADAFADGGTA
jgi:hypothetical protein